MLLAVNCGRSQSPSRVLSRRRSMRRLRLASLRCRVAFTRNPSGLRVLETLDTISNPGKAERFRVFHETPPPTTGGFAWLRTSSWPRGWRDRLQLDGVHAAVCRAWTRRVL